MNQAKLLKNHLKVFLLTIPYFQNPYKIVPNSLVFCFCNLVQGVPNSSATKVNVWHSMQYTLIQTSATTNTKWAANKPNYWYSWSTVDTRQSRKHPWRQKSENLSQSWQIISAEGWAHCRRVGCMWRPFAKIGRQCAAARAAPSVVHTSAVHTM